MSQEPPALVPELAVTNCAASRAFYTQIIGFTVLYDRPEEGFAYLTLGRAHLMIDELGEGRTFGGAHLPQSQPFGKGMNLQIQTPNLQEILSRLKSADIPLYLPPEERWYRSGTREIGQRQFVVADPDGYLLRLCSPLGDRPIAAAPKPE